MRSAALEPMDPHHPNIAQAAVLDLLLRVDGQLARTIAAAGSAAQAAPKIVGAFCQALGWSCGTLWSRDAEAAYRLACLGSWGVDGPGIAEYLNYARGRRPLLNAAGAVGAAWLRAAPVWVRDMASDETFRRVPTAMRAGLRSALAMPVAVGDQVLGVLDLCSTKVHEPDETLSAGLRLLAAPVGQFLLRAQLQQQLAQSEKRFRCLTALSMDWFWEQDAQGRFVRFEGQGLTRTGAELAPAFIGRRLWEVTGLVPAAGDWDAHRTTFERHEPFRDFELVRREDMGTMRHFNVNGDPVCDVDGGFTGYQGTARDITLHRQAAQRIHYLSTHDELTGLPNRAALRQLVNQAIELARRYERRFALMIVNVDHLARMNHRFGRDGGDQLLREVAQRLRKPLRASDIVARLDGDEFAVLAHELAAPEQAETVARKVLLAVNDPMRHEGETFRITACAGVATYPLHAPDERTLMQQAAAALRAAKQLGEGSWKICDR